MNIEEIAQTAARLIVEEGLEYGSAKRRAVLALGLPHRCALPSNERVEDAVREHIAFFCKEEQAAELLALRRHAAQWMQRLAAYRPLLGGAVWRGTATRWSDIYLQLFCDDCKLLEMDLIERKVTYQVSRVTGFKGDLVDALSLHSRCAGLDEEIGVHLMVYGPEEMRGALLPDTRGRSQRGDLSALNALLTEPSPRP
ncbi:MAG: hypothetical protein RLZZ126_1895 [Pseudomonadota bacterium]|jgi:hypothetical protein